MECTLIERKIDSGQSAQFVAFFQYEYHTWTRRAPQQMRKFPEKPSFKRWLVFGIKVGLIAEGVCLVGTYWVWHRMNTSQEFRRKMHQNFPTILNYYYLMGEKLGDLPTRQLDNEAWGVRKES